MQDSDITARLAELKNIYLLTNALEAHIWHSLFANKAAPSIDEMKVFIAGYCEKNQLTFSESTDWIIPGIGK